MEVLGILDRSSQDDQDKLAQKIKRAVDIIDRTIDLYGEEHIAFSFNGGKDCTILLHLVRAALARRAERRGSGSPTGLGSIVTFFFHDNNDFPEITKFTHDTNTAYHLNMVVLYGDFKTGLEKLIKDKSIQAIILGTRKGDPNAGDQEIFCPSSSGWPPFMRVNPVLDWSYHDVWSFLHAANLPYCSLYDQGYTSVGSVKNTLPNQALCREDGSFAPAHLLPDARLERAGRIGALASSVSRNSTLNGMENQNTAALVIIGDEILSAKVEDVNTRFLCSELRAIGWKVNKVVMVGDDVAEIASEIKRLSDSHDVVISSGGVGPTLDDVTMAGVAEAFGCQLQRHPVLETRMRSYFTGNLTEAHLKMAEAPSGSEVAIVEVDVNNGKELSPFPLVRCRNVYVLPGIPALLQKKWQVVKDALLADGEVSPFQSIILRLSETDETAVADALHAVAKEFEGIAVGSYPLCQQSDRAGIALSLESKNSGQLGEACATLMAKLPDGVVLSRHFGDDKALNSPADAPTLS